MTRATSLDGRNAFYPVTVHDYPLLSPIIASIALDSKDDPCYAHRLRSETRGEVKVVDNCSPQNPKKE